jgi:hypothetical protein
MLSFLRMLPLVSTARITASCPRVPPSCAPNGVAPVIWTGFPLMLAEKAFWLSWRLGSQADPDIPMVTPSFPGVGSLSLKSTLSGSLS